MAIADEFEVFNASLDANILCVLILVFALTFFNIKEISIKLLSFIEFKMKLFLSKYQ